MKSEVLRPNVGPWIVESNKFTSLIVYRTHVGTFVDVTGKAGICEIGYCICATVFQTCDVIDLMFVERIALRIGG